MPCRETTVKNKDLAMMSVDELWNLHEEVRTILSTKLDAEKRELERRMALLNGRKARQAEGASTLPEGSSKISQPGEAL